jgi:hypothetical protein
VALRQQAAHELLELPRRRVDDDVRVVRQARPPVIAARHRSAHHVGNPHPFALVIVSGLFSRLLISVFLMPALYAIMSREGHRLEV